MTGRFGGPDRGVDRGAATALSHVLVVGITAVLLSGLLVGLSTFVDGVDRSTYFTRVLDTDRPPQLAERHRLPCLREHPEDPDPSLLAQHRQGVAGGAFGGFIGPGR